jgi:hypothetical protein
VCASPSGQGCLADLNPLRPAFFSGQLVTADDLNAVMTYFRAKEAVVAKLVAGWGVLGGMRLLPVSGQSFHLFDESIDEGSTRTGCIPVIVPNPQIIPGSTIQVTAGSSIDNGGRILSLLASQSIDIAAASQGLKVPSETRSAHDWFGDFMGSLEGDITAQQFWVVAERVDTPTRPVPQFTGSACDSSCDFSRVLEDVRIRLVADLPLLYFLHGCLDNIPIPCFDEFLSMAVGTLEMTPDFVNQLQDGLADSATVQFLIAHSSGATARTANDAIVDAFGCLGFKFIPQLVEFINDIAINVCCTRPAVVLGRVLLATAIPEEVKQALGDFPFYAITDDAFPYRRIVPNAAMHKTLATALVSLLTCLTEKTSNPPQTSTPTGAPSSTGVIR